MIMTLVPWPFWTTGLSAFWVSARGCDWWWCVCLGFRFILLGLSVMIGLSPDLLDFRWVLWEMVSFFWFLIFPWEGWPWFRRFIIFFWMKVYLWWEWTLRSFKSISRRTYVWTDTVCTIWLQWLPVRSNWAL